MLVKRRNNIFITILVLICSISVAQARLSIYGHDEIRPTKNGFTREFIDFEGRQMLYIYDSAKRTFEIALPGGSLVFEVINNNKQLTVKRNNADGSVTFKEYFLNESNNLLIPLLDEDVSGISRSEMIGQEQGSVIDGLTKLENLAQVKNSQTMSSSAAQALSLSQAFLAIATPESNFLIENLAKHTNLNANSDIIGLNSTSEQNCGNSGLETSKTQNMYACAAALFGLDAAVFTAVASCLACLAPAAGTVFCLICIGTAGASLAAIYGILAVCSTYMMM